jgi:hypothetical protein
MLLLKKLYWPLIQTPPFRFGRSLALLEYPNPHSSTGTKDAFPLDVVEFHVLGEVHTRMGRDDCDLTVNLAEDNLAGPCGYANIALVEVLIIIPLLGDCKHLAYADDARGEIW